MTQIERVPLDWVPRTWPLVAQYVDTALSHASDGLSEDDARINCFSGRWVLFVAVDDGKVKGAAVVEFYNRAKDRVAFVIAMGGRLITGQDTFYQFKKHLVDLGATALEGAARESAARLWGRFGLTEKHRIVGVSLWADQVHHPR